jgi:hypothetical protein
MTPKDIALTTAGVLASLGLTYLLWKRSQASPAPAAVDSSQNVPLSQDGALAPYYGSTYYGGGGFPSFPSVSVPSIAGNGAGAIAGDGGNLGSDYYQQPADADSLLSKVLDAYASAIGSGSSPGAGGPTIQPIASRAGDLISGIPLTAEDARGNLVGAPSVVPVGNTTATWANGYNLDLPDNLHNDHILAAGQI